MNIPQYGPKPFDFQSGVAYYTNDSAHPESDCARSDAPLILNCAGYFKTDFPFETNKPNGRQDFYLMYVYSGKLTMYNDGTPVEIPNGSLVLFNSHQAYRYTYAGGEELSYFWVHFTGSEAAHRLSEYKIFPFPTVQTVGIKSSIANRFATIFEVFSKKETFYERELSALLERLLITASRAINVRGERTAALGAALKYIGAHYIEEIRISELARLEHLSTSRFNALFKEQTGISPIKYIINLRMSSAKDLLLSTNLPISQIGILSGYNDPQFFSKAFKRHVGLAPMEYRLFKNRR